MEERACHFPSKLQLDKATVSVGEDGQPSVKTARKSDGEKVCPKQGGFH